MKKIKNKKSLIFIGVILLLAAIGGTIAFMMASNDIENEFKTKKFDVGLEEEFYGTWGTKKVRVVNKEEENISVLLRISFNERWEHDGKILSNKIMYEDTVLKVLPPTFYSDFVPKSDGWYYYTKELKGGDEVEVLQAINLNTEILRRSPDLEEYLASNYTLTVNYEVIAYDEALAKAKWLPDIEINGSNVTIPRDPES